MEPARTPIITDAQIEESCHDLFQEVEASTDQERRLAVAGKALAPSKLLRVGVDVDEGGALYIELQSLHLQVFFGLGMLIRSGVSERDGIIISADFLPYEGF